jgi:hypothetical protein
MFGPYVNSPTTPNRLFCLFIGLSFIAIAVTLFGALKSRLLDYSILTVGAAGTMEFYLGVGLFLAGPED